MGALDIGLSHGSKVGPWCIQGELGRGGMGAVYAVVHETIGKRAALKIVHRHASARIPHALLLESALWNEGCAVNRVQHRSIVDIFDAGVLPDGRPYLVMEQLDGVSLSQYVEAARLPADTAIHILLELCDVLIAAHAAGVIHRDLKLDNVFLRDDPSDPARPPTLKVVDWGIAKVLDGNPSVGIAEVFLGTPQYVAPERARGHTATGRSDVYSLGIMAYELFLEHRPFESDTCEKLLLMQVCMAPTVPSHVWPGIPRSLEALLLAMVAKDPEQRPSVDEVRQHLVRVRDDMRTGRRPAASNIEPVTPVVVPRPRRQRLQSRALAITRSDS